MRANPAFDSLLFTRLFPSLAALAVVNLSQCIQLQAVQIDRSASLAKLNLNSCKSLDTLSASESAGLATLSLFGCRNIGLAGLEALLSVCGGSLASLDLNGTSSTQSLSEASIRRQCPALEHLDARGRALKF